MTIANRGTQPETCLFDVGDDWLRPWPFRSLSWSGSLLLPCACWVVGLYREQLSLLHGEHIWTASSYLEGCNFNISSFWLHQTGMDTHYYYYGVLKHKVISPLVSIRWMAALFYMVRLVYRFHVYVNWNCAVCCVHAIHACSLDLLLAQCLFS
jgi:hypothetical protein